MRAYQIKDLADSKLRDATSAQRTATKAVDALNSIIQKNRRSINDNFRQFAQTQLMQNMDHFSPDIQRSLAAAKAEAEQHLQKRTNAQSDLNAVEKKIRNQQSLINDEHQRISALLAADPSWQHLQAECAETSRALAEADELFSSLAREVNDKLPEYKADLVFSYLNNRHFGTAHYAHSGLIERLDRGLARLINFTEQKQQFDLLTVLQNTVEKGDPTILSAHESAHTRFSNYEKSAYNSDTMQSLSIQMDAFEDQRDDLNAELQRLERALAAYDDGSDQHNASALDNALRYLSALSETQLISLAGQTESDSDDEAIHAIIKAKSEIESAERDLPQKENACRVADEAVRRAKSLRELVSGSQFSGSNYRYSDESSVEDFLRGFVLGTISTSQLEDNLRSERRTIPQQQSNYSSPYSSRNNNNDGPFGTSGGFGGSGTFSTTNSIDNGGGFKTTGGF